MTTPANRWNETDSQLYQILAPVAVPRRAEQLATLLALLPFHQNEPFHAVEIGSGEGLLGAALLTCFPRARLTALDGSTTMRAHSRLSLAPNGARGRVEPFELTAADWHLYLQHADVVLSSLCLHHLPDEAKRHLFATIYNALSERGVLLMADLIAPKRPEARSLFASAWDRQANVQSFAHSGNADLFEKFCQAHWNYFRYDDPADRPAPLFEQLLWLKSAGFAVVDCFWLQAGHAIYGGYKAGAAPAGPTVSFDTALAVVENLYGLIHSAVR